jgi:hypothetical protein
MKISNGGGFADHLNFWDVLVFRNRTQGTDYTGTNTRLPCRDAT